MKRLIIFLLYIMLFVSSANAIEEADFIDAQSDLHKISLEEAINMALEGNIELQEQRKNLGISKYTVEKANALKNPQFQSNILMGPIARGNSSQIGLMLPIEINKRGERKQAALAELDYTDNKIKDYEFKLKLRVRTAYFDLLVAKSELRILQERKELLEELLEITKQKHSSDTNYEIDVLQADMRLKKILVQINRIKANIRTAQYNFNKTLNLENNPSLYDSKEDSVFGQEFFTKLELPPYEDLEKVAFNNRYDIKMSESKIKKAKRELSVATKQRIPDVYLAGGYAFAQDGTSGAYVGAGIDIPSLYLYTPEIESAKLELDKTQLEYNSIINITKNIIHTNYDKFVMAQENVEHYKDILEESNKILNLSKIQYKKGQTSLTNLIIVEHSHQELLKEFLDAMKEYYNAYMSLIKELGLDNLTIDIDL